MEFRKNNRAPGKGQGKNPAGWRDRFEARPACQSGGMRYFFKRILRLAACRQIQLLIYIKYKNGGSR